MEIKYNYARIDKRNFLIPFDKDSVIVNRMIVNEESFSDVDFNAKEDIFLDVCNLVKEHYNVYPIALFVAEGEDFLNYDNNAMTGSHNFLGLKTVKVGKGHKIMKEVVLVIPIVPGLGIPERNIWDNATSDKSTTKSKFFVYYVDADGDEVSFKKHNGAICSMCSSVSYCAAQGINISKFNLHKCNGFVLDGSWHSTEDEEDIDEYYKKIGGEL